MHPDTTIKQISIQALNRVIFDPLPKPSQFWSLHCNQVISDPPHWNHHGSIPEDFGNRGESTLTNLQTSKKQWQKHRKKGQTTANGTSKVFFLRIRNRGMAMGILPQEFAFEGKRKIPVAIPRFLLLKNKKKHRHSIRRGVTFLTVLLLCYGWFTAISEIVENRPKEGPGNHVYYDRPHNNKVNIDANTKTILGLCAILRVIHTSTYMFFSFSSNAYNVTTNMS